MVLTWLNYHIKKSKLYNIEVPEINILSFCESHWTQCIVWVLCLILKVCHLTAETAILSLKMLFFMSFYSSTKISDIMLVVSTVKITTYLADKFYYLLQDKTRNRSLLRHVFRLDERSIHLVQWCEYTRLLTTSKCINILDTRVLVWWLFKGIWP